MTELDQIKTLAELDGWQNWKYGNIIQLCKPRNEAQANYWESVGCSTTEEKPNRETKSLPAYLSSYDAIIPLIQKQPEQIVVKMWSNFCDNFKHPTADRFISELFDGWFRLTPSQLCEALLRATGKWKE